MKECPICGSDKSTMLVELNCKNFDKSVIYKDIKITECEKCGHVYNRLTDEEISNLQRYYEEEYAPINLNPVATCGLRPGSSSSFSIKRYEEIYNLMIEHINKNSRILDIGCAMGGLIKFLGGKGFKNLYGIDLIKEYVDLTNDKNISVGSVYDIPFEDDSFDVIVLDHILEHLTELKVVFEEIKRVLTDDGILVIGLPDASGYNNMIFWFTIREHVQHFDLKHLKLLLDNCGFDLNSFKKTTMAIDETNTIENLMALFKRKTDKPTVDIPRLLEQLKIIDRINELVNRQKPIYCYGIGREFLFLYMNTTLRGYDNLYLVDDITLKQKDFTIEGIKIVGSSILKDAPQDSILIITPSLYIDVMKKKALSIGYCGEIIHE